MNNHCKFCQLSILQKQMNRMKEENKILRTSIEQATKDYYDLTFKVAMIHKKNQKKVTFDFVEPNNTV